MVGRTCNVAVSDMTPEQRARYELKRELEFYSYYEPFRLLTEGNIAWTDLGDKEAVAMHRPSSSPDKALTAFCQLAAIRLGMRRAMVFFFDSTYAYILAEATRTLSLQDDHSHEDKDELWLGTTKIPRGYSVCEHTVNMTAKDSSIPVEEATGVVHIINNLCEDTRFCNRPYVTDGPKARFYAGVPITTEKGLNIGAFCVLDDHTHQGLNKKETAFLHDMGAAVMSHLELVRARAESRRGAGMVKALSVFTSEDHDETVIDEENVANHVEAHDFAAGSDNSPIERQPPLLSSDVPPGNDLGSSAHKVSNSDTEQQVSIDEVAAPALVVEEKKDKNSDNTAIRGVMSSAARLIRNAVEADGVAFIDTSLSGFGQLGKGYTHPANAGTSSTDGGDSTLSESEATAKAIEEVVKGDAYQVLGMSHRVQAQQNAAVSGLQVPDDLMQRMVRHHKHGTIWNFNAQGEDPTTDNTSEDFSASEQKSSGSPHNTRRKKPTKQSLGRELVRLFPGARSLALLGLWDSTQGRWYASCIMWSYSPTRVFQQEPEISYLTAWCDVIMAKINRLDMEATSSVKSSFMSSISHELRSPLHGILGSLEMLQEHDIDAATRDLTAQIDVCGRTLLDVVDHLLDFSKVNSLAKEPRPGMEAGQKDRRNLSSWMQKRGARSGITSVVANVHLNKLTEEVVEAAIYSHNFSKGRIAASARNVLTMLDIEALPNDAWHCKIAVGAWKRICLNLVNNAVKYTSKGHIAVSLKLLATQSRRSEHMAQFMVTDTGCGMSKAFMENGLFTAFKQEDSLLEGTGLGMAMVSKIVKAMRGKISVQSDKHVGTTVTVTIPLEAINRAQGPLSHTRLSPLKDAIVLDCLGSADTSQTGNTLKATKMQLNLIRRNCQDHGIKLVQGQVHSSAVTGIAITTDDEVERLMQPITSTKIWSESCPAKDRDMLVATTLVVICKDHYSAQSVTRPLLKDSSYRHVEYVLEPCGPERLYAAFLTCQRYTRTDKSYPPSLGDGSSSEEHEIPTPGNVESGTPTTFLDSYASFNIVGNATGKDGLSPPMMSATQDVNAFAASSGLMDNSSPHQMNVSMQMLSITTQHHGSAALGGDGNVPMRMSQKASSPTIQGKSIISVDEVRLSSGADRAGQDVEIQSADLTMDRQPVATALPEPRLLLVDDNAINLQLLRTFAKKKNYNNRTASNGLEAVEAYKDMHQIMHNNYAVILMDISMPVMDGFEATRCIRAYERQQRCTPATIIALTGLGSADAQQEAFASGVDLFLTKPVRLKELTSLLQGIQAKYQGM